MPRAANVFGGQSGIGNLSTAFTNNLFNAPYRAAAAANAEATAAETRRKTDAETKWQTAMSDPNGTLTQRLAAAPDENHVQATIKSYVADVWNNPKSTPEQRAQALNFGGMAWNSTQQGALEHEGAETGRTRISAGATVAAATGAANIRERAETTRFMNTQATYYNPADNSFHTVTRAELPEFRKQYPNAAPSVDFASITSPTPYGTPGGPDMQTTRYNAAGQGPSLAPTPPGVQEAREKPLFFVDPGTRKTTSYRAGQVPSDMSNLIPMEQAPTLLAPETWQQPGAPGVFQGPRINAPGLAYAAPKAGETNTGTQPPAAAVSGAEATELEGIGRRLLATRTGDGSNLSLYISDPSKGIVGKALPGDLAKPGVWDAIMADASRRQSVTNNAATAVQDAINAHMGTTDWSITPEGGLWSGYAASKIVPGTTQADVPPVPLDKAGRAVPLRTPGAVTAPSIPPPFPPGMNQGYQPGSNQTVVTPPVVPQPPPPPPPNAAKAQQLPAGVTAEQAVAQAQALITQDPSKRAAAEARLAQYGLTLPPPPPPAAAAAAQ